LQNWRKRLEGFAKRCESVTINLQTDLDHMKREKNVIIYGLKEETNEDPEASASKLFEKLGLKDVMIDDTWRLGKQQKSPKGPRPLLVKFVKGTDKKKVMKEKAKLKGEKIFINNDLSKEEQAIEKNLRERFKTMKATDKTLKMKMGIKKGIMTVYKEGKTVNTVRGTGMESRDF